MTNDDDGDYGEQQRAEQNTNDDTDDHWYGTGICGGRECQ
jgi:hypothetical protein